MTLFVVLAHSEKARAALRRGKARLLARSFPRDGEGWWVEPRGAAAIFRASAVAGGRDPFVLAVDADPLPHAGGAGRADDGGEGGEVRSPLDSLKGVLGLRGRGAGALARVEGAFALACWDGRRDTLFVARDPLGQRQVYYRRAADATLVCSELGPLLADPSWPREMDFESAVNYLRRGLPLPGRTLAKGVESVPAAHVLVCEPRAHPRAQRYWTPLLPTPERLTRKLLLANVEGALDAAVTRRLDRRGSALLLSGGVDSSYIASAAVRKIPPKRLKGYTIQYEPGYGRNEGRYAALVTRATGARHELVTLTPSQAHARLRDVLASPAPCGAWSTITHYRLLTEVAAGGERCLLSGLGADEVFGGYDKYLDYYFRQRRYAGRWARPDEVDWFEALLGDREEAGRRLFPGIAAFFGERQLRKSLYRPFAALDFGDYDRAFYRECRRLKPDAHVFEMMVAHECHHRIPDLLMSNFEPVARALGVSASYPFLDPSVVSWGSYIGPSDRYWHENGYWWAKKLLREVAAKLIPPPIVMRRRATYDAAVADWLCEPEFGPATLERFASSRFWQVGLLRPSLKTDLLERAKRLPASLDRTDRRWLDEFWVVLTLSAWHDRFIENEGGG
jgi:asparagine synthase (glutamine-hydrolysing)